MVWTVAPGYAGNVTIDKCLISQFTVGFIGGFGIYMSASASSYVSVIDTNLVNNSHGLWLQTSSGVAVGSLVLALAIRLPRSAQVTLAAIALLSSLLATLFAPDLMFARAPVRLFNGPYGHLLPVG